MKTETYKAAQPNMSGDYIAQIDVNDTQIHIISETKKERNKTLSLLKKVLSVDGYAKTSSVTYWTIQHNYPKLPDFNKDKWFFSNYDNIASAATSLSIPKGDNRFEWVYGTKYGAASLKQAKVGLERVIEANKFETGKYTPIFRIVKVTHFFDVVETI